MKLLVITNLLPDAERSTYGLHNARLVRQLATKHDVRSLVLRPRPWPICYLKKSYSPPAEDAELSPRYLTVPYVPRVGSFLNPSLISRVLLPVLKKELASWAPDAILAPWLFPDACGIVRTVRQLKTKVPVVAIAQGTDVHHYLRLPIRRTIMRQELAECAGIVCRSNSLQELLANAGIGPKQVTTIHNGVDLEFFTPDEPNDQPPFPVHLTANQQVVLFVGNLVPVKNPKAILYVASVCKTSGNLQMPAFIFVGTGPLRPTLVREAEDLGVAQHCHFVGNQSPETVARLMRRANVLAVPSRNEGVPNVIREALACGTPVVATAVGGIAEILQSETVGTLVPANDKEAFSTAIRGWLSHPGDPERIRAYAAKFSWDLTVKMYTAFLEEAIARRTPD